MNDPTVQAAQETAKTDPRTPLQKLSDAFDATQGAISVYETDQTAADVARDAVARAQSAADTAQDKESKSAAALKTELEGVANAIKAIAAEL